MKDMKKRRIYEDPKTLIYTYKTKDGVMDDPFDPGHTTSENLAHQNPWADDSEDSDDNYVEYHSPWED